MSLDTIATSAFGRRPVTRAQIAAQIAVKQARAAAQRPAGQGRAHAGAPAGASAGASGAASSGAVHKWTLLRTLSEIRDGLGVSDRALGVLSALLSYHPETALTFAVDADEAGWTEGPGGSEPDGPSDEALTREESRRGAASGLVVFPSNRSLRLRCNGMSEATLRRHLSALVEAGLIIRRDSPNGKRFVRREPGGEGVAQVFGFDLSPLVARAGEFDAKLDALRIEQRRARLMKERVNLLRRDLTKRLAFALDEGLAGPWERLRHEFLALCTPLRSLRSLADFERLAVELEALQDAVAATLETAFTSETPSPERAQHVAKSQDSTGDAAHFRRRITESNTEQIHDFEPASEEAGRDLPPSGREGTSGDDQQRRSDPPLRLVLEACPDIATYDFAGGGVADWRAFTTLAETVRPMLGISPDAWREAVATMGERSAATAIAFILQRCEHSSEAVRVSGADGRLAVTVHGSPAIRSPGGYLRALSQKAKAEPGWLWSAILGQLAQRVKARAAQRS